MFLRTVCALIIVTAASATRAAAAPFNDYLVQAPQLAPPERGSVAGALANLAFPPGAMSRGDFALAIPIDLPRDRGAPLVDVLPHYSPDSEQSEWGMGWHANLSIRRFALVGDIDMAGDEFASPWGLLENGSDGRYYPRGQPSKIAISRVDGGWKAVDGEGTAYTFAAGDVVAGGYAWMLTRVDTILGDATTIGYERNASGRPFVTAVEWGGRGSVRQYRLELTYESTTVGLDDYRSGSRLVLDRRVREVRVLARSATSGSFEVGWTHQLDYSQAPRSAAFYLTGVTRTHRSGEREPAHHYDYDTGATTIAGAVLGDVPSLDPVLAAQGAGALLPDKAAVFDLEDNGRIDFEIARDQTLVRQLDGAFSIEPLPAHPAAIPQCRPPAATANLPRVLARMTPDAAEPQVFRSINNALAGTTRVLVCNRQGVPLFDQTIGGAWGLGQTTHLVDINRDHRPDVIRIFSRGYQVLENVSGPSGYGFVAHAAGTLTEAFTPDSSWVQDMNGDGQADLIMRFPSSIAVWFGLGQFRFATSARTLVLKTASGQTVTDLSQRQLTFLDVNRDGLTDVLTTRGRLLNLFVNDGVQLNEVVVPALAAISWDFGSPVIADVSGRGNFEVLFVQAGRAKAIDLSGPATGLVVAAHDGKGTDVTFAYKRSAPAANIGQRTTVLDTVTVATSGYDAVTVGYGYGAPVLHTVGKHLIGFASVDRRSPAVTEHVEFLHDDDVSGVRSLAEDSDERTPGVIRFTREQYDDEELHGVRWLRPASVESGYRNSDSSIRLSTATEHTTYERGFCPTVVTVTSPSGQLVSTTTLASISAIADDLHCLARAKLLIGTHADPALDFNYLVNLTRNDLGQVTQVAQVGLPLLSLLVLQNITYHDTDHRLASVGVPGRGTTTFTYDAAGRLAEITDPVGVVTRVSEQDPVSDAVLALETRRPSASMTAFFQYDGRERLQASWDDVSGASEAQPLVAYTYHDPTSVLPGRIDTRRLVDPVGSAVQQAIELVAADGKPLVAGTWLGDHAAFGASSVTFRASLSARSSIIGSISGDALSAMTSTDLRALGTPRVDTIQAGFGHTVQTTTMHQANVTGTVTRELVLGASELVTRVHSPGGFTAESALDAAGKLVRSTDETGITHRYGHDALGRLVRIDTPDGRHTMTFDGFGRPARVAREGIGAIAYAYDDITGLVLRKQRLDASGAVVDTSAITYGVAARPTVIAQTAASTASDLRMDYDGQLDGATVPGQLGRLTRVRGTGWARTELFDPLGRAYAQRMTLTGWRDLARDVTHRADGSVASETLTISDAHGVRFTRTTETVLDDLGRLKSFQVDGHVLYTLTYDDEGRVSRADFASGESIAFDHDAVTHRRRGYDVAAPNASGGVHWDFDPRGLIGDEIYGKDDTTTRRDYTYDGRGALTVAVTGAETTQVGYTASGLPTTISDKLGTRAFVPTARVFTAGDVSYTRDPAGRVNRKGAWTFEYGEHGQLARAHRTGRRVEFVYNETGERLLKRVDGVPVRANAFGGVITEDHFVELVTVAGVVVGVLDNGDFTALLTDPRGTPFAGPDGALGLASPYGVRTSHLGLAEVIDYTRLGWDPDLDVVRMGIRDYDPRLAQFLTPDPLYLEDLDRCQKSPLSCSLYGYAVGNPISFVDPTGLDPGRCGVSVQDNDRVDAWPPPRQQSRPDAPSDHDQIGNAGADQDHGPKPSSEMEMSSDPAEVDHRREMYEQMKICAATNATCRLIVMAGPDPPPVHTSMGYNVEATMVAGPTGGTFGYNRQWFDTPHGWGTQTYLEMPRGGAGLNIGISAAFNAAVGLGPYKEWLAVQHPDWPEAGPVPSIFQSWNGIFHQASVGVGLLSVGGFWSDPSPDSTLWIGFSLGASRGPLPVGVSITDVDYQ